MHRASHQKKDVFAWNISSKPGLVWSTCAFVFVASFVLFFPHFQRELPFMRVPNGFLAYDGNFHHSPPVTVTATGAAFDTYAYDAALGAQVELTTQTDSRIYALGNMRYPITATQYVPVGDSFVVVENTTSMYMPLDTLVRFGMLAWCLCSAFVAVAVYMQRNKKSTRVVDEKQAHENSIRIEYVALTFRMISTALDTCVLQTLIGTNNLLSTLSAVLLMCAFDVVYVHTKVLQSLYVTAHETSKNKSEDYPLIPQKPSRSRATAKENALVHAASITGSAFISHILMVLLTHLGYFVYVAVRTTNYGFSVTFPVVGWSAWSSGVPAPVIYTVFFYFCTRHFIPALSYLGSLLFVSSPKRWTDLHVFEFVANFVMTYVSSFILYFFVLIFCDHTAHRVLTDFVW
jgi:hypothetical protein